MQLCGVDLVQLWLTFNSEDVDEEELTERFYFFYQSLSHNEDWSILLRRTPQLGQRELVFVIEKKYEQRVKRWLRTAARLYGSTELQEIGPRPNIVAQVDREVMGFLKDLSR